MFVLGFGDRLLSEVKKLAPKDVKIRVGAYWRLGWHSGAGTVWLQGLGGHDMVVPFPSGNTALAPMVLAKVFQENRTDSLTLLLVAMPSPLPEAEPCKAQEGATPASAPPCVGRGCPQLLQRALAWRVSTALSTDGVGLALGVQAQDQSSHLNSH